MHSSSYPRAGLLALALYCYTWTWGLSLYINVGSCVWVQGCTWRTWLRNLSSAIFENKSSYNESQTNILALLLLLVNCLVLGYLSLNLARLSEIWNWKGCLSKNKCELGTQIFFALCFWLARNNMKICFRKISSAKLKWKKCTRRIKHECFFLHYGWLKLDFILNFPCALIHFSSWCFSFFTFFLQITAICLVS